MITENNNRILKIPSFLKDITILETQEEAIEFYDKFVELLREKIYDSSIQLEKHHIIPLHAGGNDDLTNIIKISPEDHVTVHMYRYQAYRELGDKVAYEMRINDSNERAKIRSQVAIAANMSKKQLCWNSDWQRIQGKKGGKKGGKINSEKQRISRQKVGQKYGKTVGIYNQSEKLKLLLLQYYEWEFIEDKTRVITKPAESFSAIIDQLENVKKSKIRNKSPFYKVIKGERKKMYGWVLIGMVIRSEVKENLDFLKRSETST